MKNKILTMEDLVGYFKSNKTHTFVAQDKNSPIVVSSVQEFSSSDDIESVNGKLYCKVRVCHTLRNRNDSYISQADMEKAMPTLKDSPLLGAIHQLDDGTWDFHAHDIHEEKDENGNSVYVYDEKQIGSFTSDAPYLEYDEEKDKTYVVARVAIPEEYTRASSIIRQKGGTKVSCELAIYSCAWNAKEGYLELTDFIFMGCTCLGSEKDGTPIEEGMRGSELTIEDFGMKSDNTTMQKYEKHLNAETNKEGGKEKMNHFEELLAIYGKTVEDISFEYESLSDEELDAKFAEAFSEGVVDNKSEAEEPNEDTSGVSDESTPENFTRTYELSHEDIRCSLYKLLENYEDYEGIFIESVYEDHFVASNWYTDETFGCKYVVNDETVSLEGERYALYKEYLTDEEKTELDKMRSNYSDTLSKLAEYEAAELATQKAELLNSNDYSTIKDTEEFVALSNDNAEMSLDELRSKCDEILLNAVKAGKFSDVHTESDEGEVITKTRYANPVKNTKQSRYGNIFKK